MTILGPFAMLEAGDVIRVACDCGLEGCVLRAHVVTPAEARRKHGWVLVRTDSGRHLPVEPNHEIELLEALGARGDFTP